MSDESRPVGHPTKYEPKYAQMLIDYFNVEPYKTRTKQLITKKGDVIREEIVEASDFPSLAGFAIKIGVHRETLLNWAENHPEFFDAYKMAKEYQENYMAINGNKGLINPTFGIFTAKNVLGWRDKQPGEEDKTVTHKGEVTVNKPDVQDRIKQIKGE